jgi:dissimilatory sulfite reductase (desulfoviridin) alpha/beta subunit
MTEEIGKKGINLNSLKAGGVIKERGKDLFTVRLRTPGGRLPVSRLKKIAEVADRFKIDFVHLTVRQSMELIHVKICEYEEIAKELEDGGQKVATCGARLRVPVACGGCEYNPNGLLDTQASALEVDEKLFATPTGHHKFKVAFSGCPFDCPKAAINDVGFIGAVKPELSQEECIGCGLCTNSCSEGAIEMGENDKPVYYPGKCVHCGDCIRVCPAAAWKEEKKGYSVFIGGKWGRRPLVGTRYAVFLPAERVVDFVTALLDWYRERAEGLGRIRLGDVIVKTGADALLGYLRNLFPEYVVEGVKPPRVLDNK